MVHMEHGTRLRKVNKGLLTCKKLLCLPRIRFQYGIMVDHFSSSLLTTTRHRSGHFNVSRTQSAKTAISWMSS